jgi:tRNA A-37 threonylcarbamoyl transferase component Bud32
MALSGKMFIKTILAEGSDNEIELQNIAAGYDFCPRILKTEEDDGEVRIHMEDVEEDPIVSVYGENPHDVPEWIWNEIRRMILTLYEEEGIEYVDITPYNFIEKNGRIYMIDFGHAKYKDGETDWFLTEFLSGENSWNPDYK